MSQKLVAGVDEAGCGPLAGPVVAGAVILSADFPVELLKDSKKLTEKRREVLFQLITQKAICWASGRSEVEEIDEINILQARLLAMQRAVSALTQQPTKALIDGNRCPDLICPSQFVIGGDNIFPEIMAASIIAKVTRDREMVELGNKYPEYGFSKHKGYGTAQHLAALKEHGPTPIHRKTFAPVAKLLASADRNS